MELKKKIFFCIDKLKIIVKKNYCNIFTGPEKKLLKMFHFLMFQGGYLPQIYDITNMNHVRNKYHFQLLFFRQGCLDSRIC